MSPCATCPRPQGSRYADNQVGVEIQTLTTQGWQGLPNQQYASCCDAEKAFIALPKEGAEYRTYPILINKPKGR